VHEASHVIPAVSLGRDGDRSGDNDGCPLGSVEAGSATPLVRAAIVAILKDGKTWSQIRALVPVSKATLSTLSKRLRGESGVGAA